LTERGYQGVALVFSQGMNFIGGLNERLKKFSRKIYN